jgi:hypothetical protein
MPLFVQGHSIVIGVGDHQEPLLRAPITAADAQGVADALKDPAVGGYPPDRVYLLQDAQATRDSTLVALEQLAHLTSPTDTVFFYFCGHGVLGEDGLYYFTTQDTVLTPDNLVRKGTGVSGPEILDRLRAIPARKLLFIINACFSGHLSPALGAPQDGLGTPPSATLGVEVLATGEGRALITASRPMQKSYYRHSDPHTVFGQALIDGLRGQGVANSGGYIGLYELYQHIFTRVKAATNGDQEPVLTILQGVGPFPVALYPGGNPDTLAPPPIRQTPAPDTAVEVVERAVVQAIGRGAQAVHVRAGGNVAIDQGRKVIDFGAGNTIGNVTMGDVAGRDIRKVTITTAVATVSGEQEWLARIDQVRATVARLTNAARGQRQDADDELRKAREAIEEGDRPRLLEKLEGAQRILLSLGGRVPAALPLAEEVGTLLQKLMSARG